MNRLVYALVTLLLACTYFSTIASADCGAPAAAGVRICTPTPNATISGAYMEINSAPRSGSIHRLFVYIDNKIHYQGDIYQTGVNLSDGSVFNGTHRLVVKAWDTGGNVLQASRTFTVINAGAGPCAMPASPGINLCDPPAASYQPNRGIPISVAAKGYSTILSLNFYVDNKLYLSISDNPVGTSAASTAGPHTIKVIAR